MRHILIGFLLALALPATASAGGFATVGLAPPPASVGPGDTWNAQLTVLQHGRTPMEGSVSMTVYTGGGEQEFVLAKPTDRPGVYRAAVTVPEGEWRYTATDPFGVEHRFPSVEAAAVRQGDRPPVSGASSPWPAIGIGLAALALLGGFGVLALRRSLPATEGIDVDVVDLPGAALHGEDQRDRGLLAARRPFVRAQVDDR